LSANCPGVTTELQQSSSEAKGAGAQVEAQQESGEAGRVLGFMALLQTL
jgi:hypothetical protein